MRFDWDDVLRGLVDEAFDLRDRGGEDYLNAVREIVDTHRRWPMIACAVERAEIAEVERHDEREYIGFMSDLEAWLDSKGLA